ncbi:MAG: hypothetical protein ACI4SG_07950 [Oligosphaeraceae bacterium]
MGQSLAQSEEEPRVIRCCGCECECEVLVELREGIARVLGGNNCPTGESFALAQCPPSQGEDRRL